MEITLGSGLGVTACGGALPSTGFEFVPESVVKAAAGGVAMLPVVPTGAASFILAGCLGSFAFRWRLGAGSDAVPRGGVLGSFGGVGKTRPSKSRDGFGRLSSVSELGSGTSPSFSPFLFLFRVELEAAFACAGLPTGAVESVRDCPGDS